ncbi:MAG: oxygenase MpaB family protein [bacterium]
MLRAAQRVAPAVDVPALEAQLAGLVGQQSLFPLDSALARVGREGALLLFGPRAALLQLAHPFVAQAIADHSRVLADLQARFRRTMALMYRLTFAPPDEALAIARALHARHAGVEGTLREGSARLPAGMPYRANEVEALFWVAATLWDTSVLFHDRVLGPLDAATREAYLADARRFGRLFGIPEAIQPPSWPAFQDYMDRMLRGETLAVTGLARQLGRDLLTPRGGPQRRSSGGPGRSAPGCCPGLRVAFGLPYGLTERALFATSIAALRRIVPRLPPAVRFAPAYQLARARAGLGRPPGPISRVAPRVALWLTAGAGPLRAPPPPPG